MPPSIRAAHAGVTTGEWTDTLRELFGEYRAPTGVVVREVGKPRERGHRGGVRKRVARAPKQLGRPLKILVGKPGLDGHSNGAEQIAVKARDVGMEVVYDGIRLTPDEIVQSARDEGVHVIGLSILSGSHGVLVIDVLERSCAAGPRRHPGGGGRHHPRRRRPQARERGRGRRLHARRTSTSPRSWARWPSSSRGAHAC